MYSNGPWQNKDSQNPIAYQMMLSKSSRLFLYCFVVKTKTRNLFYPSVKEQGTYGQMFSPVTKSQM